MADRVIPNSLNYADIKPEAVESEIKLLKFTPQTSAKDQKGGDIIKFLLTGNGFLDPYSTSFRFTVEVPLAENSQEIRFLDRSAHSFINRIIIRSQGVELERIQDYDVIAAMIHDVLYSPEQNQLHHWEGFPAQQAAQRLDYGINIYGKETDPNLRSSAGVNLAAAKGNAVQLIGIPSNWQYNNLKTLDVPADNAAGNGFYNALPSLNPASVLNGGASDIGEVANASRHGGPSNLGGYFLRAQIGQLLMNASSPMIHRYIGEIAFGNPIVFDNKIPSKYVSRELGAGDGVIPGRLLVTSDIDGSTAVPFGDIPHLLDYGSKISSGESFFDQDSTYNSIHGANQFSPFVFGGHENGRRVACIQKRSGTFIQANNQRQQYVPMVKRMTFIIPIYSGLIGVLQPDKKLIPLNLIPLDIEILFNPHALYSSETNGSREYRITEFNMYSHMIFFESEIHRSLEAAVAEHGIFLYCNGFHQAPTTLISGNTLPSFAYISMNLKSINSIHLLFYYTLFETSPCARKLHFVSHNLTGLQILNGTQLIPPEPITGKSGTSIDFSHLPFLVSMYQAWNKLHDPKTDGAISGFNYCSDLLDCQADPTPVNGLGTADGCAEFYARIVNKQQNVGRCQYGISLEGEELGVDKTMVTGRKSQYPFLVYLKSEMFKRLAVPSYLVTFLRADYIVYLRPDLQIVVLGK